MPGAFEDDDQIISTVNLKSSSSPPSQLAIRSTAYSLPIDDLEDPDEFLASLKDDDIPAHISDNIDIWWRQHSDSIPDPSDQLLTELAAAESSSFSQPQTRRSQRERKKPDYYGRGKASIAQEPLTYKAAMTSLDSDKWQQAIIAEYQSIVDAGVWQVYDRKDLPKERKAINSRWVFTVKLNSDGFVERYKARLVVKGYSQVAGIDYEEIFAPVTRYDSLRLVIALAVNLGLLLEQLDIKTAFLNEDRKSVV